MRLWRRRAGKGSVVLGRELADAMKAEKRHRAANQDLASPLAGVAYDASTGGFDLHRFVASPVDRAVGTFAAMYGELDADEAREARAALSMDDLYTLLAFVRRSALASLQGRSTPSLHEGLAALTAIDADRVDWRDVSVAAELLAWAMARAGMDHVAELERASERCEAGVADALRGVSSRPAAELEPAMYSCIETPHGPALAQTEFEPFDPTVDLVRVALAVQEVIEADAYRVSDLTVATDLPPVWLTPAAGEGLEAALEGVRACVSLSAELDPEGAATARDQLFIVFLAEAANETDARRLAAAAHPTKSHEAVGLSKAQVCCVVVASSFVVGVKTFERRGALSRFVQPLSRVLDETIGPQPGDGTAPPR